MQSAKTVRCFRRKHSSSLFHLSFQHRLSNYLNKPLCNYHHSTEVCHYKLTSFMQSAKTVRCFRRKHSSSLFHLSFQHRLSNYLNKPLCNYHHSTEVCHYKLTSFMQSAKTVRCFGRKHSSSHFHLYSVPTQTIQLLKQAFV